MLCCLLIGILNNGIDCNNVGRHFLTDTYSQALSRLLNVQLSNARSRSVEPVLCYGDCVYKKKAFFSCPVQRKITKRYKSGIKQRHLCACMPC